MIATRTALLVTTFFTVSIAAHAADGSLDYRVLATSKTSTMEKELNEGAAAGYHSSKAMGGKSTNGGQEVIVAMVRHPLASGQGVRTYKRPRNRQDLNHAKRNATGGGSRVCLPGPDGGCRKPAAGR